MKLFTIFFYVVGTIYLNMFLSLASNVPLALGGGILFVMLPVFTVFNPLIALAGFSYAYYYREWKLLTYYSVTVVIPVSIYSCYFLLIKTMQQ